jgi:hypothetical protein
MKHSWQEKLDEKGLMYVELSARLNQIRPLSSLGRGESRRWIKEQVDIFSSFPDLNPKRKVKLGPEFVRALLRTRPEIELDEEEMLFLFENESFDLLRAEELELHQRIFVALELNPKWRFEIYGGVASVIVFLRRLFSGGLKKQLGPKTPNPFQLRRALAQNFEWIGSTLRGDLKETPGRFNVALAGLINKLLEHQKEPLTQFELYSALHAAGVELPEDFDAFRLWLHRARKAGFVNDSRTSQEEQAKGMEV